jgi:hypothetical protein
VFDDETAGVLRLVGLLGLFISFLVWALAERLGRGKVFVSLGAGAALISTLIYFLGVMAASDSGAHRFLPRFPWLLRPTSLLSDWRWADSFHNNGCAGAAAIIHFSR